MAVCYIREKVFAEIKDSLKEKKSVAEDLICKLFEIEKDVDDKEPMIPIDTNAFNMEFEGPEELIKKLQAQGAAEALVKARELFESNPDEEEEDERPQPMTCEAWRECLEEPSDDEECEEEDDSDCLSEEDGTDVQFIRQTLFKELQEKAKGGKAISREELDNLFEFEDLLDETEMILPFDAQALADLAEDAEDMDEIIKNLGEKGFIDALGKALEAFKDDEIHPVSLKVYREEMAAIENMGEESEEEDGDDDEEDDEDDEEVEEPATKKAKTA